jgi:hypothetical protein
VTTVKLAAFLAAIFFDWSPAGGRAQSPQRIEIIAKRFTYDPEAITLKRSEPVVLVLHTVRKSGPITTVSQ